MQQASAFKRENAKLKRSGTIIHLMIQITLFLGTELPQARASVAQAAGKATGFQNFRKIPNHQGCACEQQSTFRVLELSWGKGVEFGELIEGQLSQ